MDVDQFVYEKTLRSLPKKSSNQAHRIADAILRESKLRGFDPLFIMAVIAHESRFKVEARGSHGEIGLMQLKPATAAWVSRLNGLRWDGCESLTNPVTNIRLGTRYLAMLRKKFDARDYHYLTAYNLGETRLRRFLRRSKAPVVYSNKVIGHYVAYHSQLAGPLRLPGSEPH